jgi:hypothetical protein
MKDMNVIQFKCDNDLKKYTDSMLFDSGTIIASMQCEYKGHVINVDLKVCGYVTVDYKGDRYRYPSEFPQELKEQIKVSPNWWENEETCVHENNWFEYIYNNTFDNKTYSDGILFEDDLSRYSMEMVENELKEICKYIVDNV